MMSSSITKTRMIRRNKPKTKNAAVAYVKIVM